MKAVRLPEPGKIELIHMEKPVPGPGEALLRVRAAGVCGSDIGALRGTNSLVSYPRIIGHELACEVLSIPDNDRGIRVGDRVIADPYLYCGECYPCSIGRTNCCTGLNVLGVHVDGGMAEYFTHPADMLVKAPDDMPWEIIPLAEPLTIALHGLHRAALKAGEHIAIFGAGPIGLLAAMSALHYGAVPVVIDPVTERLAQARAMGVKHTVDPTDADALESSVLSCTGGQPPQVVMECSGAATAILACLNLVSNAGRMILTGWPKEPILFPTDLITKKEIDIRGARTSAGEFEEALELIGTGKVDVRAILTSVVPIENAVETIRDIERNPGSYLKVNISID